MIRSFAMALLAPAFFAAVAHAGAQEVQEGERRQAEPAALPADEEDPRRADAADASANDLEIIVLRDGRELRGQVLRVQDDRVVMALPELGIAEAGVPMEKLSAASQYTLLRRHLDQPRDEVLAKLVEYSLRHGMYHQAIADLEQLQKLRPQETEELSRRIGEAREKAARRELERARRLIDLNEPRLALERLEDAAAWEAEPFSSQARELAESLADTVARQEEEERRLEMDAALSRVWRLYQEGLEAEQEALADAGDLGDARDDFHQAIFHHRRALAHLDEIAPEGAETQESGVPQADRMRARLESALVNVYVTLGHHEIVRGDRVEAHRLASLAQAIEPDSSKVWNLRTAIAAASGEVPRGPRRR